MQKKAHQYTVRGVPASVDRALRKKASERGTSLNVLVLDLLRREAGVGDEMTLHHDLDAFIGTWVADPDVDRALAEQRRVDERDWR